MDLSSQASVATARNGASQTRMCRPCYPPSSSSTYSYTVLRTHIRSVHYYRLLAGVSDRSIFFAGSDRSIYISPMFWKHMHLWVARTVRHAADGEHVTWHLPASAAEVAAAESSSALLCRPRAVLPITSCRLCPFFSLSIHHRQYRWGHNYMCYGCMLKNPIQKFKFKFKYIY